ncbi:DUF4124 domain-containing protein [Zoogloea sp.]|uniref:DUF4124 domain-containing protein n=1 Tax=Zoogloea sp. TaxID=49181 RepID=UPI00261CE09A|nr:DUF4124 domain-containing protein [Zoogloea sp.]MDD3352154.1 DUF4124 domain-containing protein [Zoogloea sp.]
MMLRFFLLLVVLSSAPLARADIFKCVDDAGHVTYTNARAPGKGCTVLSRDQAVSSVSSAPPRVSSAPLPQNGASQGGAGFPRVDGTTQRARDSDRRRILEEELASEQRALEVARRDAAQDPRRSASGAGTDRVQIHERNIEALRRELSNLR